MLCTHVYVLPFDTQMQQILQQYDSAISLCLSSLFSCLPLRKVEQWDDGGLSVVRWVLGHNLLHPGVVLVREVEERRLVVVRRVSVL